MISLLIGLTDCYICPAGEILTYSTTTKEGYREYKSPKQICATCPFLEQCTQSKDHQKVVIRHIWQEYVEEAEHLRHHKDVKPIYAKRKETIERVFADAKEKHGMRWTTLRGLKKLSMQAMLTFAAMNLKRIYASRLLPQRFPDQDEARDDMYCLK